MRAYPLPGRVGGGWALEIESFLGNVKWQRADRRVPFGAQKTPKHYARGCINHWCINSYYSFQPPSAFLYYPSFSRDKILSGPILSSCHVSLGETLIRSTAKVYLGQCTACIAYMAARDWAGGEGRTCSPLHFRLFHLATLHLSLPLSAPKRLL